MAPQLDHQTLGNNCHGILIRVSQAVHASYTLEEPIVPAVGPPSELTWRETMVKNVKLAAEFHQEFGNSGLTLTVASCVMEPLEKVMASYQHHDCNTNTVGVAVKETGPVMQCLRHYAAVLHPAQVAHGPEDRVSWVAQLVLDVLRSRNIPSEDILEHLVQKALRSRSIGSTTPMSYRWILQSRESS